MLDFSQFVSLRNDLHDIHVWKMPSLFPRFPEKTVMIDDMVLSVLYSYSRLAKISIEMQTTSLALPRANQ